MTTEHRRRRFGVRRRRGDRGVGLIEVLLGITLLSMVATASISHISKTQKTTFRNKIQDEAVSITYQRLETDRAFGCGVETGTEPGLALKRDLCGGLGWTETSIEGDFGPYTVTVDSLWQVAEGLRTPSSCANFDVVNPSPTLLVRRATTTWNERRTQERRFETATVESVPGDAVAFLAQEAGSVVVKVDNAEQRVRMVTAAGVELSRSPMEMTNGDFCVWFPNVAVAQAQVYEFVMPGGGTQTLTVPSEGTTCFTPAGGAC